jgi:hypothetical protein
MYNNCIIMACVKIEIQILFHGYQDCLIQDAFQKVMSVFIQDMEYVETIDYLDDWLILTNSSFKDHLWL